LQYIILNLFLECRPERLNNYKWSVAHCVSWWPADNACEVQLHSEAGFHFTIGIPLQRVL